MRHAFVSAMTLMLAAVPAKVHAQTDWWDWALNDVAVDVHVQIGTPTRAPTPRVVYAEPRRVAVPRREYEEYRGRVKGKRGAGPAFCRSGAGHPVHGRRWCLQKGFGLGGDRGYAVRWERERWGDVVFGGAWYRTRAEYLEPRALMSVVGARPYHRLDEVRRRMGVRDALVGRWVRPRGGALVLQIRSGSLPIAELSDLNADGRVDVVMVARW